MNKSRATYKRSPYDIQHENPGESFQQSDTLVGPQPEFP